MPLKPMRWNANKLIEQLQLTHMVERGNVTVGEQSMSVADTITSQTMPYTSGFFTVASLTADAAIRRPL